MQGSALQRNYQWQGSYQSPELLHSANSANSIMDTPSPREDNSFTIKEIVYNFIKNNRDYKISATMLCDILNVLESNNLNLVGDTPETKTSLLRLFKHCIIQSLYELYNEDKIFSTKINEIDHFYL